MIRIFPGNQFEQIGWFSQGDEKSQPQWSTVPGSLCDEYPGGRAAKTAELPVGRSRLDSNP